MSRFLALFFHRLKAMVPVNAYVAEDGVTGYVAEDGLTYYVQES